jgi:hypothetical protein
MMADIFATNDEVMAEHTTEAQEALRHLGENLVGIF